MKPRRVMVYSLRMVGGEAGEKSPSPLRGEGQPVGIPKEGENCARVEEASFEVACGKGTYVRSLARDIAGKLGTFGYVSALRRLAVGKFDESRAISLDNLEKLGHTPALVEWVHPIESALDDIPALSADSRFATKLRHGQSLPAAVFGAARPPAGRIVKIMSEGRLVALAEAGEALVKPIRVFNV